MWTESAEAFALGNSAILTNVCLLPLYPGLIAFLAGNAQQHTNRRAPWLLGVLVLAGILSMMLVIGLVLHLLRAGLGDLLPVLLPILYALVIALGVLMLAGYNPFARMATLQAPIVRSPYATAFLYGMLLGPMTLPCTGPIITGAFLAGSASTSRLAEGLSYFLFFGLGFGWPLVALPLVALPAQRRITSWLASRHVILTRVSGLLLIAIGLFGLWTEVLPNL
jgi:cytochrome c-type biogenesis protein